MVHLTGFVQSHPPINAASRSARALHCRRDPPTCPCGQTDVPDYDRKFAMESPWFILMVAIVVSVSGRIPDGFVLKVTANCGPDDSQVAEIQILSDLDIKAYAQCVGQQTFQFSSVDAISHVLTAVFNDSRQYCQFFRADDTDMYTVPVFVQWGTPDSPFQMNEQRYTVICTFNDNGQGDTDFKNIVDPLVAPASIHSNMGAQSNSSLQLRMTDILGRNLTQPVHVGRYVKLAATADNTSGAVGLKAVNCDAIGLSTTKKFAFLRAGCGDGLVIPKSAGFITSGLTSISPHFTSFTLHHDHVVRFECNFTMCLSNCDGSSCATEKRKRSADAAEGDRVIISFDASFTEHGIDDDADDTSSHPRQPEVNTEILTVEHWMAISLSVALVTVLAIFVTCAIARKKQGKEVVHMKINP